MMAALVQSNCVETSQFLAGCETLKQSVKQPWCQSVVSSKGRDQRRRNFEDRSLQFWSSELRRRPDQQNGDDDGVSTLPRLGDHGLEVRSGKVVQTFVD